MYLLRAIALSFAHHVHVCVNLASCILYDTNHMIYLPIIALRMWCIRHKPSNEFVFILFVTGARVSNYNISRRIFLIALHVVFVVYFVTLVMCKRRMLGAQYPTEQARDPTFPTNSTRYCEAIIVGCMQV